VFSNYQVCFTAYIRCGAIRSPMAKRIMPDCAPNFGMTVHVLSQNGLLAFFLPLSLLEVVHLALPLPFQEYSGSSSFSSCGRTKYRQVTKHLLLKCHIAHDVAPLARKDFEVLQNVRFTRMTFVFPLQEMYLIACKRCQRYYSDSWDQGCLKHFI
jgi:hypothetical protein